MRLRKVWIALAALLALGSLAAAETEWPTLRGNCERTGFVQATLKPPFHLAWARHFAGERLGSAVEPIVAGGRVFAATQSGSLYALEAASGKPLWRFAAHGAFLHSPAVAGGIVVAGTTEGILYGVEAATGKMLWSLALGRGGYAASPAIAGGIVYIGTRGGLFLAAEARTGATSWVKDVGVPFRQSAAVADGRVYVTGEDLRARCFNAETSRIYWESRPLMGQTARDYYPVVAKAGPITAVIVRTNPVAQMSQVIAQDRAALCKADGVDDRDWKTLDAWLRSDRADGTPEQAAIEQQAIEAHLRNHPESRTFYVLDPLTGLEQQHAPVLWCGGCQGVGAPPDVLPDGRLLVQYRSAYGHWSLGVAPLVALGAYDLRDNRIILLRHAHDKTLPWNTFWGTADESQSFVVAGGTLLIVHQGTLSGYDLASGKLLPIWGARDTWGGFRNLPWARNEWHGPARGGVAVADGRLYWQTGSRILCVAAGQPGKPAEDVAVDGRSLPANEAPQQLLPDREELRSRLAKAVAEAISKPWAPLYVEPGLAGREFFFDDSGETLEALARACPHLAPDLQKQLKAFLADQWQKRPPYTREGWYPLDQGERREWFTVPPRLLARRHVLLHHPFGNVYAAWLYAERCGEWPRVLAAWLPMREAFQDFAKAGWRLDGNRDDLFANRYLASLVAFARIADRAGDGVSARQANAMAAETAKALAAWWTRAAAEAAPPVFPNVGELDRFLLKGDPLFLVVNPHCAKIALFRDLSPEVADLVKAQAPDAVARVWRTFETLCSTWYLVGEERQVHFGENFIDGPDFALGAYEALAWLCGAPSDELRRRLDIPFCRADLAHIAKLAIALDAMKD